MRCTGAPGDGWITDKDTGEKVRQEVPIRMRRWWWNDDTGKVMLEVRYGNKPLELQPGKPTIEIGEQDNLLPALSTLRQGIVAGELDKLLMDAKRRDLARSARLPGRKAGNFDNQRLSLLI